MKKFTFKLGNIVRTKGKTSPIYRVLRSGRKFVDLELVGEKKTVYHEVKTSTLELSTINTKPIKK